MVDNSKTSILATLGELAINWNVAEAWIRTLAGSYAGKTVVGEILTIELGTIGLQNVLCAVAKHAPLAEEADALLYCAKLYERLRGYRNYYIHGTIFAVEYANRPAAGFTYMKSAKGQIKSHGARVEAHQIQTVADQCYGLALYARQIYHHLHGDSQNGGARPPLPDKPPLPPEVDKNAPYPQSP